jgi:hypothetical protein
LPKRTLSVGRRLAEASRSRVGELVGCRSHLCEPRCRSILLPALRATFPLWGKVEDLHLSYNQPSRVPCPSPSARPRSPKASCLPTS